MRTRETQGPGSPGGLGTARYWRRVPRLWRTVLVCGLAAALVGTLVVAGGVFNLERNLDKAPLDLSIPDRSTSGADAGLDPGIDVNRDPLQILIIGTDTRTGNRAYGTETDSGGAGLADVMMLLHLSADRTRSVVLSFPRDLVVPLPACEDPETGRNSPAMRTGQLNSTLQAGPGCTVAAINGFTGLQIDHLMVADFQAVEELTEVIGGVEVCVTEKVNDPKSGLVLPAGVSKVKGEQALAYLRTRSAFADGSDTARISAQQSFLASMARKVTADGTLQDLPRLYSIADTITKNLTVDEDLAKIPRLIRLAQRLSSLNVADVEFITVPNEPWPSDPNRVQLINEPAQIIFDALSDDTPVKLDTDPPDRETTDKDRDKEPTDSETTPTPRETPASVKIDKSGVPVAIRNRSGETRRGSAIQNLLIAEGFTQARQAVPSRTDLPVTQVFYNSGWEQAAALVATTLGVPAQHVLHSGRASAVEVSIGADFTEGSAPEAAEGVPEGLQGQTAEQITCQPVR